MNTYYIFIRDEKNGVPIADAHGELDVIQYVARKAKDAMDRDATYSVDLSATDGIGQDSGAPVLTLTADGDVLAMVLTKKLRNLARAAREQEEPQDAGIPG